MVDGFPETFPPSMTRSTFNLRLSEIPEISLAGFSPVRLALVPMMGRLIFLSAIRRKGWSGILKPTVPFLDTKGERGLPLHALGRGLRDFKMSVTGPGQNFSAIFFADSEKCAIRKAVFKSATRSGNGLSGLRPLSSNIFFIVSGAERVQPRP